MFMIDMSKTHIGLSKGTFYKNCKYFQNSVY